MPGSVVDAIPPAVLAGLILGGVFSLVATGLFLLGERAFPTRSNPTQGTYSSEARRRTEIREYLNTIGERYVESSTIAGTSVDFYLPERDVVVTFDAKDYFRLRNATDMSVILVEHEMPGTHLGSRLPFETPELPRKPRDREERTRLAYEVLGLPTTADREEIRRAYRERIKEVHPDHGGDEASFRRIQDAYATVTDDVD